MVTDPAYGVDYDPTWRRRAGVNDNTGKLGLVTNDDRAGFDVRSQIIWAKDRLVLSCGDYHWQHEPCWYAIRQDATGHRTEDRTQTTLWTIPARDDDGHGHGTQKPVECMRRPMQNHLTPMCTTRSPDPTRR